MPTLNNENTHPVKWTCYGDRLQAQLEHCSPTNLALLGHELETGAAALTHTTPRQTTAIIPVINMALLRTVRRATAVELAAMRSGNFTVEELHKDQLAKRRPSDLEIDRFIERAGAGPVLDGLDRATRPRGTLTATNGHAANNNGGVGINP
jgi:hypothetical protein